MDHIHRVPEMQDITINQILDRMNPAAAVLCAVSSTVVGALNAQMAVGDSGVTTPVSSML
ncbi:MAG: hypothetical protein ABGZ35_09865 [Planctomycetaceae bacterium]